MDCAAVEHSYHIRLSILARQAQIDELDKVSEESLPVSQCTLNNVLDLHYPTDHLRVRQYTISDAVPGH